MYSSENDICQLTQGKISLLSSEEVTHFRRSLPKKHSFLKKNVQKFVRKQLYFYLRIAKSLFNPYSLKLPLYYEH